MRGDARAVQTLTFDPSILPPACIIPHLLLDLGIIALVFTHSPDPPKPNTTTLQGQNHGEAPAFCASLVGGGSGSSALQHGHDCFPVAHCSFLLSLLNPPFGFLLR